MQLLHGRSASAMAAAFVVSITAFSPSALAKFEVGKLTCEVSGGGSFIIGSTKDLHCTFRRKKGPSEAYVGKIEKLGLDLGPTGPSTLVWGVLAATKNVPPGELAGGYGGVSTGAAVGIGGNVNVLVGGNNKTITLQPISVVGEKGLNVTAAIAGMTLKPIMFPPPPPPPPPPPAGETVEVTAVITDYGCGGFVVVYQGETLSSIAKRCGVTVEALLRVNPEIKNVRELQVGEKVVIPIFSGKFKTSPCGAKAILQPGETVPQLAARCGVTVHALAVANITTRNLSDIKPGVVLTIPPYTF